MKWYLLMALMIWLNSASVIAECLVDNKKYAQDRAKMVSAQLEKRDIKDALVLSAMRKVARHCFVPRILQPKAYADSPLPIGQGQTISQPYIVALMTQTLSLTGEKTVLEIGTGSGYQAAVLAEIVKDVVSIEIKQALHQRARQTLNSLGYTNITTIFGDGYFGWEHKAPYDCIMITAAVDHIPPPLLKQLKDGGRLVLPLGNPFSYQNLVLVTKRGDDYSVKQITGVLFVPMTGKAMEKGAKR